MKFNINKFLLGAGMVLACTAGRAQLLEDIIVETYYISDADDATDSDGGSLPVGSTTYRIFVDMVPGAELETIFGDGNHTLFINSTTGFFNNEDRGATFAEGVGTNRLGDNTVAVDSWFAFGGGSSTKIGVLKSADTDGSIVGGANNDGGSAGIGTGLLKNADALAGIPLTTADGLINGTPAATGTIGLDVSMFDDVNSTTNFSTTNGAWFTLGGTQGVDPNGTNRLLVAQITVLGGGQLSFELNMRINDGQGNFVDYVANNPQPGEVVIGALTFPQASVDCEGTPGGTALPGTPCNDNSLCTTGDTWDMNCNCVGTPVDPDDGDPCTLDSCDPVTGVSNVFQDADGDGTCDAFDVCPGGPEPGTPCDDGSLCTSDDIIDANCNCVGTPVDPDDGDPCTLDTCDPVTGVSNVFQDADGDGTCDALDVCPGGPEPGSSCDDGDMNTINDTVDANCNCVGTPLTVDCEGVPGGMALPGTPCNDNSLCTTGDTWDMNCNCVGIMVDPDDNNACTIDSCDPLLGVINTPIDPDDGDPCTLDTCDPVTGVSNVFQDADGDGTCDANDVCPGGPEPGSSCDDGDMNTINDTVDANCNCVGTPLTTDCEGTPGGTALPGTPCDDGNANTTGDTWDMNCNCVGTPNVDCEGIPGGNALPGTPCNDGNINTVGETWDANCNCTGGQLVDCEGTPGGTVLPGSPCDDNNAFTTNDTYDANCNCVGVLPTACDGQPGGLEDIIVETYYVADANDAADTDGGGNLIAGAKTYRIYADMAPGYTLETVYGDAMHLLQLQTSTFFYNQEDRGEATGDQIDGTRLDENTLAIDSWLAFGAAADSYWGILKADDPDGSIVGGANNDGGSNNVPGGLLANNDASAGIPLTTADGLEPAAPATVGTIGFPNLDAWTTNTQSVFGTNNGAWFVLGGVQGQDVAGTNRVLIAQVTTNGDFSFELNMRLGVPGGGTEDWVASNPMNNERTCASLTFQATACPAAGTPCDDGNANTINDVEDGFCNCAGTPIGGNEALRLEIRTDDFGSETTWQLLNDVTNAVAASGGPYANVAGGELIVETFAVPAGAYRLEVIDANGIANGGGFVLYDAQDRRIRIGDGDWTGTSTAPQPFNVPIGEAGLKPYFCDRSDFNLLQTIQCTTRPGATSYQFQFDDVHGGYLRWIARPTNAVGLNQIVTNPLPFDNELNVRVRAFVGAQYEEWGPACILKVPTQPACPTTQLVSDPSSSLLSCGRTDVRLDGTDALHARFILGANRYQFRFENAGLNYVRQIASNSRTLNSLTWATLPLLEGETYTVTVRASFDGGQTYCAFGAPCEITTMVSGVAQLSREVTFDEGTGTTVTMWPNPNREDVLFIKLEGLEAEQQDITIDIVDMFGKRVFSQELDNAGSILNHAVDLNKDLAPGMYLVNIQVNDERHVQRLVRQ